MKYWQQGHRKRPLWAFICHFNSQIQHPINIFYIRTDPLCKVKDENSTKACTFPEMQRTDSKKNMPPPSRTIRDCQDRKTIVLSENHWKICFFTRSIMFLESTLTLNWPHLTYGMLLYAHSSRWKTQIHKQPPLFDDSIFCTYARFTCRGESTKSILRIDFQ